MLAVAHTHASIPTRVVPRSPTFGFVSTVGVSSLIAFHAACARVAPSTRGSAVTASALAAPLAPADAPPEATDDAVDLLPALALFTGGMVPSSFAPLFEHPARANELASTPTPRALVTRRRPDRQDRERAIRRHPHNHAVNNPPAHQEPLRLTGRKIPLPEKRHALQTTFYVGYDVLPWTGDAASSETLKATRPTNHSRNSLGSSTESRLTVLRIDSSTPSPLPSGNSQRAAYAP